jgi:hypothetical protein
MFNLLLQGLQWFSFHLAIPITGTASKLYIHARVEEMFVFQVLRNVS